MNEIIDSYCYRGEGYDPFLVGPKWQVAFLSYAPAEALEAIDKLDVHYLTDEVFVLLQGKAVLIAAEIEGTRVDFETVDMEPGTAYNIRRNVWHKIAMEPGSRVLIVEDANTHKGDFEFYDLDDAVKRQLREQVNQLILKRR